MNFISQNHFFHYTTQLRIGKFEQVHSWYQVLCYNICTMLFRLQNAFISNISIYWYSTKQYPKSIGIENRPSKWNMWLRKIKFNVGYYLLSQNKLVISNSKVCSKSGPPKQIRVQAFSSLFLPLPPFSFYSFSTPEFTEVLSSSSRIGITEADTCSWSFLLLCPSFHNLIWKRR